MGRGQETRGWGDPPGLVQPLRPSEESVPQLVSWGRMQSPSVPIVPSVTMRGTLSSRRFVSNYFQPREKNRW